MHGAIESLILFVALYKNFWHRICGALYRSLGLCPLLLFHTGMRFHYRYTLVCSFMLVVYIEWLKSGVIVLFPIYTESINEMLGLLATVPIPLCLDLVGRLRWEYILKMQWKVGRFSYWNINKWCFIVFKTMVIIIVICENLGGLITNKYEYNLPMYDLNDQQIGIF